MKEIRTRRSADLQGSTRGCGCYCHCNANDGQDQASDGTSDSGGAGSGCSCSCGLEHNTDHGLVGEMDR